jgi:5-methylthioadenosine/S-adenosylhomocysteine deaminase
MAGENAEAEHASSFGRRPDGRLKTSRRELLQAATGLAVGAASAPLLADTAAAQSGDADAVLQRLLAGNANTRRILLKGGTILSMDPAVGDFAQGDVLIVGKTISAVGRDLNAAAQEGNAIVVDASDAIVIPGMIDCHRHSWEGQLRGIIPNSATIGEYMGATHNGFAPHYQPDDMYVGNLLTAIACIDAGITCFIDNSHNSRTAAHSDAAIKALFDSGTRAVHASGSPIFGDWDKQWPQDLDRLQRQYFSSDDQLVTLRIFSRGLLKADWETARRLGLWVSIDGAGRPNSAEILQELKAAGLMDERHTINHGYGLSDAAWQLIGEAGMPVNVCPRSDSQWSLGPATMGLQDALDHGIRPGISVDNEASYGTDLFTEMRVAFHMQRWVAHEAAARKEKVPQLLKVRDLLEFATVRGAENAALVKKIGSLTPGKEADIVIIRAGDANTMPVNNAVSTVVSYANAGNVDAVFIAGHARKWRGKLVGHDLKKIGQMAHQSRDRLFARRGIKLDIIG